MIRIIYGAILFVFLCIQLCASTSFAEESAQQKLRDFDLKSDRIIQQINSIDNVEKREGVMICFIKDRYDLEIKAILEAIINNSPNAKDFENRAVQDQNDIHLYEIQHKQREIENRQIEMESQFRTNENFDTEQNSINNMKIFEMQQSIDQMKYHPY